LKQDEDFEVIPPKVTSCLLSKGAHGQGEVSFNLKPNATYDEQYVVWMPSSAPLSDRPPRVACGTDCKPPQCKQGTSGDLFDLTGIPTYPEGSKIVSGYFGACMKNATTGKLIGGGAYPVRLRHPADDPSSVVWEGGDAVCDSQKPFYAGCGIMNDQSSELNLNIVFKNAPTQGSTVNFFPGDDPVPNEACGAGCVAPNCMAGETVNTTLFQVRTALAHRCLTSLARTYTT